MRAPLQLVLALCCACGPADEEEAEDDDITGPTPVPACEEHRVATQECRDAGLMLEDGTVTGVRCDPDVNDDSWPEGCELLEQVPGAWWTYCCPW